MRKEERKDEMKDKKMEDRKKTARWEEGEVRTEEKGGQGDKREDELTSGKKVT